MARVATTMNASSQPDISNPPEQLRNLGFPLVGFLACVHSGGNGVLLARHDFLAALDQILGALAKLASLLLRVISALFSLRGQIFARFFTGFRCDKNSDQRSDSQPNEKEAYLRTQVISHDAPPKFRVA